MIDEAGVRLPLEVFAARTPELIRLADVAWAVSGSVGLELMVEALPTVVLYKIKPFDLWVARWFIKTRYISLVNLLADAEVMPEYLTGVDVSDELAGWALGWLENPVERADESRRLAELRDRVAIPGATSRAADQIVAALDRSVENRLRGPHQKLDPHRVAGTSSPIDRTPPLSPIGHASLPSIRPALLLESRPRRLRAGHGGIGHDPGLG